MIKKFITFLVCAILAGEPAISSYAVIIPPERLHTWTPNVTVGVRGGIPAQSTRTNLINVALAPYNADTNGVSDSTAAFNAAIAAASAQDVIFAPAGRYRLNGQVTINKPNITLRGAGTNNTQFFVNNYGSVGLMVGADAISADQLRTRSISGGATKGSTNLSLTTSLNDYGDPLAVGQFLRISELTRNRGNATNPIISVFGYDRIISCIVQVHSVSGTNFTITQPLAADFTHSPQVIEMNIGAQTLTGVGLEDFNIAATNYTTGEVNYPNTLVRLAMVRDSWVTGCDFDYAHNYHLNVTTSINVEVRRNTFRRIHAGGSNRAALLAANSYGLWAEDNIFGQDLFPAIEPNEGLMGCAFTFNYFSDDNGDSIVVHNAHPKFNLYEGNRIGLSLKHDGYFGSYSDDTIFRNYLRIGKGSKRFGSRLNIVGNYMGNTNYNYTWMTTNLTVDGSTNYPYPLIEVGRPNIGNFGYEGTTAQYSWNWPGNSIGLTYNNGSGGQVFGVFTNGFYVLESSQTATTNLLGNFSNFPMPLTGAEFSIIFQAAGDTNFYYTGESRTWPMLARAAGTTTNLHVASYSYLEGATVTNGDRAFLVGSSAYQQLQLDMVDTFIIHGNRAIEWTGQSTKWDPSITDTNIPTSIIYASGTPAWMAAYGKTLPLIGPDVEGYYVSIPAEERYNGIVSGGGGGSGGTTGTVNATTIRVGQFRTP